MIRILIPGIFLSAVVLLLYSFSNKKIRKPVNNGFAVVELFTSEGCSSCPPADEAVADIQKEYPDNVYVLGFHVDYWNYLGWKDEYSNPVFTKRQQEYGERFSLSSVYTPQAVVNGKSEFVGSNRNKLHQSVEEALNISPKASISINADVNNNNITTKYTYTGEEKAVLNFALVQLEATSAVKRGENSGRKLHHINVVRDFKTIETIKNTNGKINFLIPAGLTAKDVKLVAYAQEKNSGSIIAATGYSFQ